MASATAQLNTAAADFPLIVRVSEAGKLTLQPERRGTLGGLARILADLQLAGESGALDRLKMCASDECRWVFYDRSKPATRRWCSSALCGNRHKTRTYRTGRGSGKLQLKARNVVDFRQLSTFAKAPHPLDCCN